MAKKLRSSHALKYVPYVPSAEEDQRLIAVCLDQMPLGERLRIARRLLDADPATPFVPTPWVEKGLPPEAPRNGGIGGPAGNPF
jgi:hypothetical protein